MDASRGTENKGIRQNRPEAPMNLAIGYVLGLWLMAGVPLSTGPVAGVPAAVPENVSADRVPKSDEQRMSDVTVEVARYRDEVNAFKQAYSDLVKIVPTIGGFLIGLITLTITVSLWIFRMWRKDQESKLEDLRQSARLRIDKIAAEMVEVRHLDLQMNDVILRGFRYVTETAWSDIETSDSTRNALVALYHGLGLLATNPREVRAATRALAVAGPTPAAVQWLNQVRGIWTERLRLERDEAKIAEIEDVLACMDDAVSRLLGRVGPGQLIPLPVRNESRTP